MKIQDILSVFNPAFDRDNVFVSAVNPAQGGQAIVMSLFR
jgi:hypothetical protein